MGASIGFYTKKVALMEVKKGSTALWIGALGKHVASHRAKKIFAGWS
ncbi:MAG TPA: hypothetical protein VGU64_18795 [Terriglobales bacterium]|nr:hypothetical protein [Terriglobales bacterium]